MITSFLHGPALSKSWRVKKSFLKNVRLQWGSNFHKHVDGCHDLQSLVGKHGARVEFFIVKLNAVDGKIVWPSNFGLVIAFHYLRKPTTFAKVLTPVFCEHPPPSGVLISVDFTPLVISIGVRCTMRNLGPSFCTMMHRVVLFVLN